MEMFKLSVILQGQNAGIRKTSVKEKKEISARGRREWEGASQGNQVHWWPKMCTGKERDECWSILTETQK